MHSLLGLAFRQEQQQAGSTAAGIQGQEAAFSDSSNTKNHFKNGMLLFTLAGFGRLFSGISLEGK